MYSISLNTPVTTCPNWIYRTFANFKMAIFFLLLETNSKLSISHIFVSLQSNKYALPE
jgi:hypothetical protein